MELDDVFFFEVRVSHCFRDSFSEIFNDKWQIMMRSKLGLTDQSEEDEVLIKDLLTWMQSKKPDFTNTFCNLRLWSGLDPGRVGSGLVRSGLGDWTDQTYHSHVWSTRQMVTELLNMRKGQSPVSVRESDCYDDQCKRC